MDTSDAFLSNYSAHLKNCLRQLVEEQIVPHTELIYVTAFGSGIKNLWPKPKKVTSQCVTEVKQYFMNGLTANGGANLLSGLKQVNWILYYVDASLIQNSSPRPQIFMAKKPMSHIIHC